MQKYFLSLVILLGFTNVYCQQIVGHNKIVNPYSYTITKNKIVNKAAVVSAHQLASAVGVAIMKQGGNAYDAAIATQFALAVVYPGAGNIGGGGFLVGYSPTTKQSITIDYREKAPNTASRDMYLDSNGKAQLNLSQNGHLAAGVPGTVAGLYETHKLAKLPWATLVQPAIDIAQFGFVITQREADNLNDYKEEFELNSTTSFAFAKNTLWAKGDTLVQPDLANTLIRIRDGGKKGFYEGQTAQLIVDEMKRGKGIISIDDLKKYEAKVRKAIEFNYRKNYTVITMPPSSSGGVLLQMMLQMLDNYKINKNEHNSAKYIQLVTEIERRAYADRAEHLGDMDFYSVPLKTLQSKQYALNRMKDYKPNIAQISTTISPGIINKESEETTHLSIIDAQQNMVAVTTTLNGSYGSKTIVGGAGFLLNNEMDDFSIKPGVPNMYGAVGGEANSIAPNKRMLSCMTPTLVLKKGKPFIICGTPGGTTIITSVLQTIVNIIDFDMNAKDAVNKPKFHHQWLPDEVFVEKSLASPVQIQLQKMGYKLTPRSPIGRCDIIKIIGKNVYELAADNRGEDSAEGINK
jgi:gamma-glutamyltranspeptidase / glutathione hydrolase